MKTLISVLTFGLFITQASAQISFGDGDAPILVDAQTATYKGVLTTLEGEVDVRQGTARINSDVMEVYRENLGETEQGGIQLGEISKIIAIGSFKYATPDSTVTGSKGVYERDKGIITVTGDVKFKQAGGSVVRGKKLVYDIERKQAKFGDECHGNNCGNGGRVSFTIKN